MLMCTETEILMSSDNETIINKVAESRGMVTAPDSSTENKSVRIKSF